MTRKSTAYGRRIARLAKQDISIKSDGITTLRMHNTRLTPLEIKRILDPSKLALQAMREAKASFDQWQQLNIAKQVGIAIEDGGVMTGQRFLFDLADIALQRISHTCSNAQNGWQPCTCTGPELTALAHMIAAHSRQVHELTYHEYTKAVALSIDRNTSQQGNKRASKTAAMPTTA